LIAGLRFKGIGLEGEGIMLKKSLIGMTIAALAVLAGGCGSATESNANANANAAETAATTTTAPDNSEVTTTTDKNGVKTQTRVFRNNPRVSKVVVTTRDGNRTVKVYSPSGEERELNKNEPEDWLEATGDRIADAAGWVKDKSVTAAEKTKEGAKTAADKTVDATKTVADKTVDTSKTVANKSKAGAKTVVDATKTGVRKTGNKIKKIVTP
jgi:hypothetical protein